ncbi:hypothetical protein NKJ26_02965 [Mesorhizobium sp. M0152]|uniref:helix-turn-helix domain-containing protein n=1 Tax=Mesorhizobium sp. M0152 TaxID=2956898 RepID=UPI00333C9AE0
MYREQFQGGEPRTADEVFRRAAAVKLRLYGAPKLRNVRNEQLRDEARKQEQTAARIERLETMRRERAAIVAAEVRRIKDELARKRHDDEAFEALVVSSDTGDQFEPPLPTVDALRPVVARLLVTDIVRQGCLFFQMRRDVLFSNRRERTFVEPRQIVTWAAAEFCPHLSLPMIGRQTGGRDHTTILHSKRKVAAAIERGDPMGLAALRFAESLRTVFPNQATGDQ